MSNEMPGYPGIGLELVTRLVRLLTLPLTILWSMLPERYRQQLTNAMHPWIVGAVLLALFFILFFPAYVMNSNGLPILWQILNYIFLGNAQEAAIVFLTTGIAFTFLGLYYPKKAA